MAVGTEYLKGIIPPPRNQSRRVDCPSCGGFNTLSVSNKDGKLYYHCFRACCKLSRVQKTDLTIADLTEVKPDRKYTTPFAKRFPSFVPIKVLDKGYDYVVQNNCLDQFEKEPNRFFYDVRSDRVVFVEYGLGFSSVKLVTGRSLIGEKPKWYKYVAQDHPVFIATSCITPIAYIVEDCASACSVGRVGIGVALCGTSWDTQTLISTLKYYSVSEVNISLDEDAQTKSLKLKFELEGSFEKVRLLLFSDDPKYLTKQQLNGEIHDRQENQD